MSEHLQEELVSAPTMDFGKWMIPAWIIGILGLAACGYGYTTMPAETMQSYLYGFIFWMVVTLGFFGLTLLHHTIRGSWGTSVIRIYSSGGGPVAFLIMGILFVPIALNLPTLYSAWMGHTANPLVHQKSSYLNETAWLIRAVVYFVFWIAVSAYLRRSDLKQDRTQDPSEASKRTNLSAPMLVAFVVSVTLAITDWVMSLQPTWSSTMYGVWFVVSGGLAGLCLGAALVLGNKKKEPYAGIVTPSFVKDFGNLIMAFTMLWAYVTLSQYLIIYSGNLPELITYYVNRRNGGFNELGGFVVVFSFFVPFVILLAPRTKSMARNLLWVALWLFFMRILDMYWNVIPAFEDRGLLVNPKWTDLAALIGVGGVWFGVLAMQLRKIPLMPKYDDRLEIAYADYQEHLEHA